MEARMTNKEFRSILNKLIPAGSPMNGKGQHGRYKPTKRAYGDYLFQCDRVMFEMEKERYEEGLHSLQSA
jgi:hypothetical protein